MPNRLGVLTEALIEYGKRVSAVSVGADFDIVRQQAAVVARAVQAVAIEMAAMQVTAHEMADDADAGRL